MREIRVYFADFHWLAEAVFKNILSKHYKLIFDDISPDFVFYSCFGYKHYKYKKSVKIYYTSENIIPDFNICDYGIGFHYLSFEDRYLRFPLFLLYGWDSLEKIENKTLAKDEFLDRKFCNFIYSNSKIADPIRTDFFHLLSKYKRVDSGGKYLNNIGEYVRDKMNFISNYKFTIAFENSSVVGYTTEKIIEPMISKSIPIYWGNPLVENDFMSGSFINVNNFRSLEKAAEAIIQIDNDDNAYLEMLNHKKFVLENIKKYYENKLESFLINIIEQGKTLRRTQYGWAKCYQRDQSRVAPVIDNYYWGKLIGGYEKILSIFR
ncbi:glycosyltransferase family 10 domain-containing protein [Parabacteroides johnsonii]|jgi:hypothetical protein|uniref:glycosyltransferase family 10 domain-containing protein n=1 Tax=Parabacteroides johnsonii TaxID=387661 RepID=UPI00241C708B|nr:glycosyltransferase family 10 [Parabacteroides johnsonii]